MEGGGGGGLRQIQCRNAEQRNTYTETVLINECVNQKILQQTHYYFFIYFLQFEHIGKY